MVQLKVKYYKVGDHWLNGEVDFRGYHIGAQVDTETWGGQRGAKREIKRLLNLRGVAEGFEAL